MQVVEDFLLRALALIGLVNPAVEWAALKSWASVWTCSRRMHESFEHMCLLGCRQKGEGLPHYIQCPRFQALAALSLGMPSGGDLFHFGLVPANHCPLDASHAVHWDTCSTTTSSMMRSGSLGAGSWAEMQRTQWTLQTLLRGMAPLLQGPWGCNLAARPFSQMGMSRRANLCG